MLSETDRICILENVPLFRSVSNQDLKSLVDIWKERVYPQGSRVFSEGACNGLVYVIVSGQVALERETSRVGHYDRIETFDALSSFGEFHPGSGTTAALAVDDTLILEVHRDTLIDKAKTDSNLLQVVLGLISQRLRDANEQIADLRYNRHPEFHKMFEKVRLPVQESETQRVTSGDREGMVYVPAGHFFFGDERARTELPGFWIDKTPVTNAEYKRFLDANPSHSVPYVHLEFFKAFNWDCESRSFPEGGDNHPVVLVSLLDAVKYANWVGKRLPSEQEWEKAARGVDGKEYPWGDVAPTKSLCNLNRSEKGPTPISMFSPQGDSPFGCADMVGNVWEWTTSDYDKGVNILRGGSWFKSGHMKISCTKFCGSRPAMCHDDVGFRCVLDEGE